MIRNLFPSLYEVKRLEEVVLFTVGLMSDPSPLLNHVYELWNERLSQILRGEEPDTKAKESLKRSGRDINKLSLLSSLYTESAAPLPGTSLQNQHVNIHHGVLESKTYTASRLYEFNCIVKVKSPMEFRIESKDSEHTHDCMLALVKPAADVSINLLTVSRSISQKQPISDLYVDELKCDNFKEADVFNMSRDVFSVRVYNSSIPYLTLDHLCRQLSHSSTLCRIDLSETSLKEIESHTFASLPSLSHLDLTKTDLCQIHLCYLRQVVKNRTSPKLSKLKLGANGLLRFQNELEWLLKTVVNHHQRELQMELENNKLPTEFQQKWRQQTEETKLLLFLETR